MYQLQTEVPQPSCGWISLLYLLPFFPPFPWWSPSLIVREISSNIFGRSCEIRPLTCKLVLVQVFKRGLLHSMYVSTFATWLWHTDFNNLQWICLSMIFIRRTRQDERMKSLCLPMMLHHIDNRSTFFHNFVFRCYHKGIFRRICWASYELVLRTINGLHDAQRHHWCCFILFQHQGALFKHFEVQDEESEEIPQERVFLAHDGHVNAHDLKTTFWWRSAKLRCRELLEATHFLCHSF